MNVRFGTCCKSDYSWRLERKRGDGTSRFSPQSILYSPVWRARIATNGLNSLILGGVRARILCSSDLLAEGKTFELSVQVFSLQVVNVPGGYRAGSLKENFPDCLLAAQSMRTRAISSALKGEALVIVFRKGSISLNRIG